MKRFLLALFIPIAIVAALNGQVILTVLKAWSHPSVADQAKAIEKPDAQPDNTILIPALGLQAPLIASPADPTEVSDWGILKHDLMKGVSLSEKRPLPGQPGTTIVLGHSSDISPHAYSAAFASLNELDKGDLINLRYKGQTYRYVTDSKIVVMPNDPLFTGDFKRIDRPNQLALVTCWPLFTTAKRLVVVAVPQP